MYKTDSNLEFRSRVKQKKILDFVVAIDIYTK